MITESTKKRSPNEVLVTIEDWCMTLTGVDEDGGRLEHVIHDECPPAMLAGCLRGERPVADPADYIDPRGIGVGHAEHTSVSADGGSARAPFAVLLGMIEQRSESSESPPSWPCAKTSSDRNSIDAFEGVAAAVADRVEQYLQSFGASLRMRGMRVLLPVSNSLTLDMRERLISWGRQSRIDLELVWRPVAAALGALRHGIADQIRRSEGPIAGHILVVHLGLESFEMTPLELRCLEVPDRGEVLVPARRMPTIKVLRNQGLRWIESAAERAVGVDAARAWHQLWATDWLKTIVGGDCTDFGRRSCDSKALLASEIVRRVTPFERWPELTRLRWSLTDGQNVKWGYPSIDADRRARSGDAAFDAWIKSACDALGDWGSGEVVTVIGTGVLSAVRIDGVPLASSVARRVLGDRLGIEWIEGDTGKPALLHREGFVEYTERKRAGIPPYFDVLPAVEVLVTRHGEPGWQDLLDRDDEFVPGGQIFQRRRDDLGLGVCKEEECLTLTIAQEGFTTVRETETHFARPVQSSTAVDMDIRIQPGQGYPKIEVIPRDPNAFSGARVELDWRRVADTDKTKQQALDEIPRTNPPLNPRMASVQAWTSMAPLSNRGGRKVSLVQVLDRQLPRIVDGLERDRIAEVEEPLRDVAEMFRRSSVNVGVPESPYHATAVGSDGLLAPDASRPELLKDLRSALDDYLAKGRNQKIVDLCLRCLAYSSSETPNLMGLLGSRIRRRDLSGDTLNAIGCCLRSPDLSGLFMRRAFVRLRCSEQQNHMLRALCRILQYREDALGGVDHEGNEASPSDLCELLSKACLDHIIPQVKQGNLQYIYRHGSLAIVYLLRRRRYDDNYLPPDHPIAEETKAIFREVIMGIRSGNIKTVGGFVDILRVTKQMIDYIDRKGRGRLVAIT